MDSSIVADGVGRDNSLTAATSMSDGAAASYLRDFPDTVRSPSPMQISKCNSPHDRYSAQACALDTATRGATGKASTPSAQDSAGSGCRESAISSPFRVTAGTSDELMLGAKNGASVTATASPTMRAFPSGPHRILNPAAKEFQMPSWSVLAAMQPSSGTLPMSEMSTGHTQEPLACSMAAMDMHMCGGAGAIGLAGGATGVVSATPCSAPPTLP